MNITLPQITAVISILFMIRFIWNFNKFEDIFLLTGGASGTRTLPINVYEQGFSIGDIGMGSAVSMVIVLLLLFFMLIYFKLMPTYCNNTIFHTSITHIGNSILGIQCFAINYFSQKKCMSAKVNFLCCF